MRSDYEIVLLALKGIEETDGVIPDSVFSFMSGKEKERFVEIVEDELWSL